MKKMYCYDCDKDVEPLKKKVREHYDFRGQSFDVTLDLFYCPYCDNELIDEEIDNQLTKMWNAYLNCYGLSLNSFKFIRNDLGLSQDLFAKALGWNRRSIIRYENRDEVPQKEYLSTYVKLNNNRDYILECLNANKNNLTSEEYKTIINRLQLDLSLKARNAIIFILKDNPLYVLQLNKNMFAVDFMNYKNSKSSITNFKYIKMARGPVIDGYKKIISTLLRTGEIRIADTEKISDTECFKYVSCGECFLDLFTKEEIEILENIKLKLKGMTGKDLSEWSHKFKGWIDTPLSKVIDYDKYAKNFNL